MFKTFFFYIHANFTKIVEALWQAMLRGESALSMTDSSSIESQVHSELEHMRLHEGYTGNGDSVARARVMARKSSAFIHPYM